MRRGITPWISGKVVSAIGMVARSAMISVMTNSNGCISPICLLPIILIKKSISAYNIKLLQIKVNVIVRLLT